MTARHPAELDRYYAELESQWATVSEPRNAALVVPNGNSRAAVHRWFRMKEAYSCELVQSVLATIEVDADRTLNACDPFAGSGTTGVSLAQAVAMGRLRGAAFTGLETNPFLHLVSQAKLSALVDPPADFARLAQRVGAMVKRRVVDPAPIPELSTFANPRFFPPEALSVLLTLKTAIEAEAADGATDGAVALARICLGAIVEPCSRLRRDGRALRYEPDKPLAPPLTAFLAKVAEVEEDLAGPAAGFEATVHERDARQAEDALKDADPFSLVLFSPPYPNNIDYTEVYKLEAWLLGLYNDQDAFRSQRRRTLRSHASLDFGESPVGLSPQDRAKVDTLVEPLLNAVQSASRYSASRQRTIRGYAYDMLETLRGVARACRDDAHLVYVVGNSLHGGRDEVAVLIAADLIIAQLAEIAGFSIDRIEVARTPVRRATVSPFLRESVVFARRRPGVDVDV